MNIARETTPFLFDLTVTITGTWVYFWSPIWNPLLGVSKVDCTLDPQRLTLGTGTGIELLPAIQFAEARIDRPDAGAVFAGTSVTTATPTHFQETVSATQRMFFRTGVAARATGTTGPFMANAQGALYTAFCCGGVMLPAEEIVLNPWNDKNLPSFFPIGGGRLFPASQVAAIRMSLLGMGSNSTLFEWMVAARTFNDPMLRGDFTLLEGSAWRRPNTTDFAVTTADILLSGVSPNTKQWIEPAIAVRKPADNDPNSRLILRVLAGLRYTV